jgi:hypothetical protein
MDVTMPADRRGTVTPFSIGDPGRAARELPAGAPTARIGHADVELTAATLRGLILQAATSRGLHHRVTRTPRQDAFAVGHSCGSAGTERAVAVVCDGVGSFGRSDEAAAIVSRHLAGLGAEGVPWPGAFARANDILRAAAEAALSAGMADAVVHGMATTAVAVAVHREADEWVGEAAWVGDSTLWHLSPCARWTLLTGTLDDDPEATYHSTGVIPLPSADGACASCEFRVDGGALFLMTDGVANPLRWSEDVRAALAGWWMQPPDPFTFAAQVSFARKTHLDDRTVIGIWPDAIPGSDDDRDDS